MFSEHPLPVYPRACGGTAAPPTGGTWKTRVYPRACGGTSFAKRLPYGTPLGSIPAPAGEPPTCPKLYVRGTVNNRSIPAPAGEPAGQRCRYRPGYPVAIGSIPAPAGEPLLPGADASTCGGLSPRLRGNPCIAIASGSATSGLSPRLRGNRPVSVQSGLGRPLWLWPVYPRACGGTH